MKKINYLYYIIYLFIAWFLSVYFAPSSETIRSVIKIIIWGIPLFFICRSTKFLIFKKDNSPLDFRIITKSIIFTSLFLLLYVLGLNQVLNYSISTSISIWFILNGVIIAPIIEEIVFRGYLLQKLQNNFTFWKANIIQSFLFVCIHFPQWFARGREITIFSCSWVLLFGILLGFLKRKTKWLWTCIIIHSIGNILLKTFLDF